LRGGPGCTGGPSGRPRATIPRLRDPCHTGEEREMLKRLENFVAGVGDPLPQAGDGRLFKRHLPQGPER